jgi:prevent-host-death family protein
MPLKASAAQHPVSVDRAARPGRSSGRCRGYSLLTSPLNVATYLHKIGYGPRNSFEVRRKLTVTTLTSREFNQDTSGAKKAASQGPVFITDRGRPAHVLLTIEDYLRLTGGHMSLAEALAQPGADFDFNPPRVGNGIFKPADLG